MWRVNGAREWALSGPIRTWSLLLVQTQAARWQTAAPKQLTGAHLYLDITSLGYLFHGYSAGFKVISAMFQNGYRKRKHCTAANYVRDWLHTPDDYNLILHSRDRSTTYRCRILHATMNTINKQRIMNYEMFIFIWPQSRGSTMNNGIDVI